jgi:hypothetical protein
MSSSFQPSTFLRYALIGDAVASGATGLLLTAGAGLLSGLLGLPQDLLFHAGLFLLPYAAAVAFIGTREAARRTAVWGVILLNGLWVIKSIALLLTGWVSPTTLGTAFVVAQAVVVLGFAEAQYIALRRTPRASAATA